MKKQEQSGWFLLSMVGDGAKPKIWREVRLSRATPLSRLHKILQTLFGWEGYHLHHFLFDGNEYMPEEMVEEVEWGEPLDYSGVSLGQLLKRTRDKMVYCYDYGDGWEVVIQVKEAGTDELPGLVMGGERAGPKEDCGGVSSLHELVKILAKPKHPQYSEMRTWAGRGYRPEHFSVEAANRKLFPRATPKPVLLEARPLEIDYPRRGPALELYNLKKLKTKDLLVAALIERGGPLSLEQLVLRIQAAGYPLPL